MPANAQVAIFEDDDTWQENFTNSLEASGHKVTISLSNIDAIFELMETWEAGKQFEILPDVFIVDDVFDHPFLGEDNWADTIIPRLLKIKEISGVNFHIINGSRNSEIAENFKITDFGKTNTRNLGDLVTNLPDVSREI